MCNPQKSRDARTILLYNTNAWKREQWLKGIGQIKESGRLAGPFCTYASLDGTQALLIYPAQPSEDSWLRGVWEDRRLAAGQASPDLRCRSMHLVSQQPGADQFWAGGGSPHILLMTVIYGVTTETDPAQSAANQYESVITDYLNGREKSRNYRENGLRYRVYNTMDVGDIVVLWLARDIHAGFQEAISISQAGLARKTHTTLFFPIEDSGKPALKSPGQPDDAGNKFQLVIAGAIRDHAAFGNQLLPELCSVMELADQQPQYMPGRDDFRLVRQDAGPQTLYRVLLFFAENANQMCCETDPICWTLRAYCSPNLNQNQPENQDPETRPVPKVPTDLLDSEYREFKGWLDKHPSVDYPWGGAMGELLGLYAAMDGHPAFHGVGYLIWDCVHVFNAYLNEQIPPYQGASLTKLLRDSESEILRYVECLSQLTDRLVRMDELTLGGVRGYSPIYGMLPENMLRFCYGFVREFVDLLTEIDRQQGVDAKNFAYGFLLFPGLGREMKISQVLKTKVTDWEKRGPKAKQIFPEKQLYLLEFPAQDMYRPESFFPQIFHECLHRFGDTLRLREERKKYMAAYLAACAAGWLNRGEAKELHSAICCMLYPGGDNASPDSAYLEVAQNQLADKLRELFNLDGSGQVELAKKLNGGYSLYSNRMLRRWIAVAERCGTYDDEDSDDLITSTVKACAYLFRECYADAMMMAFTGLTPEGYLTLMASGLDSEECDKLIVERIAIVLASYALSNTYETPAIQRVKNAIDKVANLNAEYKSICLGLKSICLDLMNCPAETASAATAISVGEKEGYRPAAALRYVVDYILTTINNISPHAEEAAETIKSHFQEIAINKNFFGDAYYEIYGKEHNALKDRKQAVEKNRPGKKR